MMNIIVFFIISAITVLSAIAVISTQRIMHSVLSLAVMLLSVAALYATLNAEFLAVIQVLVYAGGVVVLLLFATMLTRSDLQIKREPSDDIKPAAAAVFAIGLLFYIVGNNWESLKGPEVVGSVKNIGMLIFNVKKDVIPFEIISLVLLAAMVGAIFLGREEAGQ
ncbi:MAG TPA: NADH-quinone oxidoreductase subunit J [Euryarchaeota archaeon]|nr:NADH-quinone oxidoreductase subunit J [archaeon BMS3Bbin15]HDL14846.1 NADH-quinone oxidoreductase subunit J [Euryarchaeota archaeon]